MLENPVVFFLALFLTITALWTLLGWALGRYAGEAGVWTFVALALFTALRTASDPKLLRGGIGLLPLLVGMAIGYFTCRASHRRRARLQKSLPPRD